MKVRIKVTFIQQSSRSFIMLMKPKITYYKDKGSAAKNTGLLCNRDLSKYFVVKDHNEFLEMVLSDEIKCFFELVKSNSPVPIFFDIEIYAGQSDHFNDGGVRLIDHIISTISSQLEGFGFFEKKIITEAHNEQKKSFHMILVYKYADDSLLLFKMLRF